MSGQYITRFVEREGIAMYSDVRPVEPEPVFRGWTSYASQRSVRAVAVCPTSGHVWVATWGGVLWWDRGKDFSYRRYGSEHGLAGNAVACVCVDAAGRPWAGQEEGGLSYFDGGRWNLYEFVRTDDPIRNVCGAGPAGGIWAAGRQTIYRIADPAQPPANLLNEHRVAAGALALLARGEDLLVGNARGLFRLRPGGRGEQIAPDSIDSCVALSGGGPGGAWVGSPEGVYKLEGDELVGPFISDEVGGRVTSLAAGRGGLWVLTTEGLARLSEGGWGKAAGPPKPSGRGGDRGKSTAAALRVLAAHPDDYSVLVGTDDLLWRVAYDNRGEPVWENMLTPHTKDSLNNLARCAARQLSDGTTWVGTAGGSIKFQPHGEWSLDPDHGDVQSISGAGGEDGRETVCLLSWPNLLLCGAAAPTPPGLPIAVAAGQDGRPYAMTSDGLWRLDGAGARVAEGTEAAVTCLAQAPDGLWWLGTTEGVYRQAAQGWGLAGERPGPCSAAVHALLVFDGLLWAATESGLWSRRHDCWVAHGFGDDAEPRGVYSLAASEDGRALWVAREDGIFRYEPRGGVIGEPLTPSNSGLASRRVTSVLESGGSLWVTTHAGVSRLKLDS